MAGCDVSKIQIENYQVPSFIFMRFKSSLKGSLSNDLKML